jgi:tetratricopeptide (TPR) repeat protein
MRIYISNTAKYFAAVVLFAAVVMSAHAQTPETDVASMRAKAVTLVKDNKYLEALPILEKIAPKLPNDEFIWTSYGIATAANSTILKDAAARKAERKKAHGILSKAKELGTENVMALDLLDQIPADGGDDDNFGAIEPQVEDALREGEGFFGRGEYAKAFAAYEKAYKLDPKNYEAVLFMGDSLYAEGKYAASEPWFAKAAAIDPDRDMAFRFWGDALLAQNKVADAEEKFIEGMIANPYSRYSWNNIVKLAEKFEKEPDVVQILPPGSGYLKAIAIDDAQLKADDGTDLWREYSKVKNAWKSSTYAKEFTGTEYRETLKEEIAALSAVAKLGDAAITSGKLKTPHESITNLVDLYKKNLLEPYVLIVLANNDIAQDYMDYRAKNRAKIKEFLDDCLFVF